MEHCVLWNSVESAHLLLSGSPCDSHPRNSASKAIHKKFTHFLHDSPSSVWKQQSGLLLDSLFLGTHPQFLEEGKNLQLSTVCCEHQVLVCIWFSVISKLPAIIHFTTRRVGAPGTEVIHPKQPGLGKQKSLWRSPCCPWVWSPRDTKALLFSNSLCVIYSDSETWCDVMIY